MQHRTHHIALVLAAALSVAACTKHDLPERNGDFIEFSGRTVQLQEATKGVMDNRTSFDDLDKIKVSAWHHQEQSEPRIFNNQVVEYTAASDTWSYSPKQRWRWSDNDWYDFLAVPNSVTATPNNSEPFTLTVHYDARASQYDLLMAGTRHKISDSDPGRKVSLDFQHMLSAVKVVFYKYAGSEEVIVSAYHFSDLLVSADIEAYWNEENKCFSSRQTNTLRLDTEQFGEERDDEPYLDQDNYLKTTSDSYDPGFYDLLLPQDLDAAAGAPSLVVRFMDNVDADGVNPFVPTEYTPDPIPLKDIPVKGTTDQFITRWEPGQIYEYEVHILFNGGVLVNVTTTPWEDIQAQTPGLMI